MKDRIVWGMIGCGDVTEVKNGPGLYLAEHSFLKGVWNRTREKAVSWTERHGHGTVYDTVDSLLADPEIDIVYIATTPNTHAEFAIRCAKAGKHALVEKPVAPTLEDGMRMREAFREAERKCFVCFYRREMERFRRLAQIVSSGEIGAATGVQLLRAVRPLTDPTAWRARPEICGGDLFTETEIHALDIVEMLLGPVGTFSYAKGEGTYCLSACSKAGLPVSGLWNYTSAQETDCFVILGTDGRVELEFFRNDSPLRVFGRDGYHEETVTDSRNVGLNMEQAIVNELLGRGSFSGTLDAALETLAITSAMYFGK